MPQKVELKIAPPAWMTAPGVAALLAALDGQARFVGGCVRNTLLDVPVEDVDLATPLTPPEVIEKLEAANIRVIPTGIEHGTVTAVIDGRSYEITTLRRDVETDGRRAVVAFTQDWREDALRRDFTMNTLLADAQGQVFDPLGQGLADLRARKVVFVGDASARIAEDYLRILRFFRFHALYGRGAPDGAALAACRAGADKIASLSKERITQEFFKILSVDAPQEILALMFGHGVLREFETPEYDPALMGHVCAFQQRYGLAFIAARLLVLAGFSGKNLEAMEKILLIPRVFRKDIEAIIRVLEMPDLDAGPRVKEAVYRYGRIPAAQALMIELAQDRVMNGYAPEAIAIIQKWEIPNFPVSGNDLMQEGYKPGPELGARLADLEERWIKNGFRL